MKALRLRCLLSLSLALVTACVAPLEGAEDADATGVSALPLSSISCSERSDTGYVRGDAFSINVVTVDGKPVELETANAYYVMAQEASRAGVEIRIVSGFRTMSEQQYFWNCYQSCSCNSCNLAARPGYSNHQSGHALDLNTSAPGVLTWLNNNGARFGFRRTVSSEPWHWEWWGGGPGGGPCGRRCDPHCSGSRIVSADCGVGDCAAYGATCVDDSIGLRCASVFCPARGDAKVCLDDRTIATCDDGAISTGDCGAYGAYCSTAGVAEARCVSVFCVESRDQVPTAHDVCLPNGQLARCNAQGIPTNLRDCGEGTSCQQDETGAYACLRGGESPRGALDAVSCELGARGWAQDPDEPDAAIRAHVYFDGTPGAEGARAISTLADIARDDLCSAIGSCAHGFSVRPPYALFDGVEHEVRAYGINLHAGSNAALPGGPLTMRCDAPSLEGVRRHVQNPDSFGAWGFRDFEDRLPATDEVILALPEGSPAPLAPRLVSADGSEDVYLLDGAVRRFVDAAAFAMWRFDADAIEATTADVLETIPEGPAVRPRPQLVRHSDGAVYVIDDSPVPDEMSEGPELPDPTPTDPTDPDPTDPTDPSDADPFEPGTTLSGGCAISPRASSSAPLLALLALVFVRRRSR